MSPTASFRHLGGFVRPRCRPVACLRHAPLRLESPRDRRRTGAGPHAAVAVLIMGWLLVGGRGATARTVVVPGGTPNALGAAVAKAGPNGTVVLQAGVHRESGSVVVTQPVTI